MWFQGVANTIVTLWTLRIVAVWYSRGLQHDHIWTRPGSHSSFCGSPRKFLIWLAAKYGSSLKQQFYGCHFLTLYYIHLLRIVEISWFPMSTVFCISLLTDIDCKVCRFLCVFVIAYIYNISVSDGLYLDNLRKLAWLGTIQLKYCLVLAQLKYGSARHKHFVARPLWLQF